MCGGAAATTGRGRRAERATAGFLRRFFIGLIAAENLDIQRKQQGFLDSIVSGE